MPTRFGQYEPLRHRYADGGAAAFERCWLAEPATGDVIFKTGPTIGGLGWVRWRRAWNQTFNSASLYLPVAKLKAVGTDVVLRLAEDLFCTLGGTYGMVTTDGEFQSQHCLDETDTNVHGVHLEEQIPGVYFANFFGPELVKFLGADRLASCPAVSNKALPGGGWCTATAESPLDWADQGALDLKRRVRSHLGERKFFDIEEPNAATVAPLYDFSEVRVGERP